MEFDARTHTHAHTHTRTHALAEERASFDRSIQDVRELVAEDQEKWKNQMRKVESRLEAFCTERIDGQLRQVSKDALYAKVAAKKLKIRFEDTAASITNRIMSCEDDTVRARALAYSAKQLEDRLLAVEEREPPSAYHHYLQTEVALGKEKEREKQDGEDRFRTRGHDPFWEARMEKLEKKLRLLQKSHRHILRHQLSISESLELIGKLSCFTSHIQKKLVD